MRFLILSIIYVFILSYSVSSSLYAAECEKPKMPPNEDWVLWLKEVKELAIKEGISKKTIELAFNNLKPAKKILLRDLNLLVDKKVFDKEILVKVRSTGKLIKSKLNINNGKTNLNLLENEYGISPGQACVFYSKDENGYKVLGGGWIKK